MAPDPPSAGGAPDGAPSGASHADADAFARRLAEEGTPFVRATVVRREPPVSATVGDRAVVTADGDLVGWVGGVECAQSTVVREALSVLEAGQGKLVGLGPDPDALARPGVDAFRLTCHSGGSLEVFLEPVVPAPRLLVVGGSPIARSLVRLAGDLAFDVAVVDPDADRGGYPDGTTVVDSVDPGDVADRVGSAAYVVVASVGEYDRRGVVAAATLDADYVGLVASDRRAREVLDGAAEHLDADATTLRERVSSPAGLDVGAETPEEIAVSVLAEVVRARRTGGAGAPEDTRPGADVEHPDDAANPGGVADADPATDPVCGMEVSSRAAAATVDHDGETFHFCSQGCADAFADSPGEYLGTT